ncbi:glycosyltransferase family 39 protein [uncultured Ruegeria sp.]|uniref:DUF7056 domain-containing protein n=1 Tax=uncultured Ruegeria sp. TaxID=259304 RepID=UPI002625374C|nr:glycosyltransferase family 39 protein [uncultured Ruegeria sp.]
MGPTEAPIMRTSGLCEKHVSERLLLTVKVVVFVKIAILFSLAINTRFVMDEFWHFTQPVYLFDGTFETIWPKKAVGYAVFYELSHLIGWDATSMLMVGRLMTACLAVAIVWCIYLCCRSLGAERVTALIAVALLLSFSNFIERGFRLRSEPLATLLGAMAVLVIVRYETDRAKTLLIAGLLSGFAFVTTQKSIYFNFALGTALTMDALFARSVSRAIKRGVLLVLGWIAAIAIYAVLLGGSSLLKVLEVLFLGPAELALNGGSYYEGLDAYIWQTLKRNSLQYGLVIFGLILTASRVFKCASRERIFFIFTVLLAVLVFFHNQTWPYVFVMALPFLAIYGADAFAYLTQRSDRWSYRVLGILIIITVLSTARNVQYLSHDNHAQLELIRNAEAVLDQDDTYFDGIGMIPSRRMEPRLWLDAQAVNNTKAQGKAAVLYDSLLRSEPKLVLLSYRTDNLGKVFNTVLETNYVFLSPNIMLPRETHHEISTDRIDRPLLFESIYSY